jgi:hypothetical protein
MQDYIIKSFKRIHDNAVFVRQETGTNSGGYVYTNPNLGPAVVKRLNDFLCDGGYVIHSVIRQNGGSIVFTVGDRVVSHDGVNIDSIKIIMSDVILYLTGGTGPYTSVRLLNAVKYVAPTPIPVSLLTERRPVGRPRKEVATNTFFTDLEARVLAANPDEIRLEATLLKSVRKLTLEQFLIKFFKEYNNERNTIFVESRATQTEMGKRRSLGDIYKICKYYFPEITLKELMQLLYVDLIAIEGFRSSKCSQIGKRVWYYYQGSSNVLLNTGDTDEYSNSVNTILTNLNN